jgi:hypothetical protein
MPAHAGMRRHDAVSASRHDAVSASRHDAVSASRHDAVSASRHDAVSASRALLEAVISPQALTLFAAWHVALSYSLQLYFDFSGYSDMAIGLARMFNLRFPFNFNSPYKAASVIEYWQR